MTYKLLTWAWILTPDTFTDATDILLACFLAPNELVLTHLLPSDSLFDGDI